MRPADFYDLSLVLIFSFFDEYLCNSQLPNVFLKPNKSTHIGQGRVKPSVPKQLIRLLVAMKDGIRT
jgi:hypothetical protein